MADIEKILTGATSNENYGKINDNFDGVNTELEEHLNNKQNPHQVTKAQVGLANVDNTSDANKPISTATQQAIDDEASARTSADNAINAKIGSSSDSAGLNTVYGSINSVNQSLSNHIADVENPHQVTKAQVGLGNVDNTSDDNKPVSGPQQTALNNKLDKKVTDGSFVYTHLGSTQGEIGYSSSSLANNIVQRDTNGEVILPASDPKTDNSATRKKYVDDNIASSVSGATNALRQELEKELELEVSTIEDKLNTKVDKVEGKELSSNDFTDELLAKLNGIEEGAQVNTVTSVAGKTGAVILNKSDVGLASVDNTSDANKPVSTAQQLALDNKVDKKTTSGNFLYSHSTETQGEVAYSSSATANNIVQRDTNGEVILPASDPKTDNSATRKAYVDSYVATSISGKQDKNDNTLTTTDKTVVGAINEVMGIADGAETAIESHTQNTSNPHNVTRDQIGAASQTDLTALTGRVSTNETDITNLETQMNSTIKSASGQVLVGDLTVKKSDPATGNLVVEGDLTVKGTTITESTESLAVETNMIITNASGADLQGNYTGLAMKTGPSGVYGIVYDPSGSSNCVKLGLGTLDESNEFSFNEGEGFPITIRNEDDQMINGHLVMWDSSVRKIVDAGSALPTKLPNPQSLTINGVVYDGSTAKTVTTLNEVKTLDTTSTTSQTTNAAEAISGSGKISLHKISKTGDYNDLINKPIIPGTDNFVTLDTEQEITGKKTLTEPILDNPSVEGNLTFASESEIRRTGFLGMQTVISLPSKSGTLALTSDIPVPKIIVGDGLYSAE